MCDVWLLLLLLLPALKSAVVFVVEADAHPPIARRGCNDTCGNVSIPFPFGIGAHCFLDHWFEIECRPSPTPSPFLSSFNLEVTEINVETYLQQSLMVRIPPLNTCGARTQPRLQTSINLTGSPYSFIVMDEDYVFVMEGCPGSAVLLDQTGNVIAGCATVCDSKTAATPVNSCYGVQCCQIPITMSSIDSLRSYGSYQIDFNRQATNTSRDCLVAALTSRNSAQQFAEKRSDQTLSLPLPFPATPLSWSWTSSLQADNDSSAVCTRYEDGELSCRCHKRHTFGNAYVCNGCQVPEACKGCRHYCAHTWIVDNETLAMIPGGYFCESEQLQLAAILGVSISVGVVLLVIGLYGLYRLIKWRREVKRRAKFFKRNGGLLLQQQLSSEEGVLETTKIFTIKELNKATDNFNSNRILGKGGQGTVYKGMLMDGRIVAVKKANLLDESQLEQFINELVILSQINHRNVVKMLGCCLETEVPLLVYEFIPNGTLSQHIHDPDEDFAISWEMRLKIAADSASAIAYLHSSSSIPIYHRDIKSSNILLDEKYRARVSDFGSSKTIAIDQTHLTTLVQGTMGYLDPEYFQSYQFTDKSDVYSFGVVLLEILTGRNPIYRDASTMEQKNLVTELLFLMQSSRLSEILDPEIMRQAREEELVAILELAKCCISRSGKLRPTMKEVAMALEMIMKSPGQASTCYRQDIPSSNEGFAVPNIH